MSKEMERGKQQLLALTGMRFLLAFWVVVYHQLPAEEHLPTGFPLFWESASSFLHTGYSAVSVFFVLSGFVLAYNYNLELTAVQPRLQRFLTARFARIYPAYAIALLLLLPLGAYRFFMGIRTPDDRWSLLMGVLLLQAWVPKTALTWNFPAWSLSAEAFFYLCFPYLGLLLARVRKAQSIFLLMIAVWALAVAAPLVTVWLSVPGFGDNYPRQWQPSADEAIGFTAPPCWALSPSSAMGLIFHIR